MFNPLDTTGMPAGFLNSERLNQSNDSERKGILELSPVLEQGGKSSKLLSLQPYGDLEAYSKETGSSLGTEKTRTRPVDGSSVQPRWASRHSGHKFRGCSGNSEQRKGRDLRLERLSSSYNQDKGLSLIKSLWTCIVWTINSLTGSRVSPTSKGVRMKPFFSLPVLAFAFITLDAEHKGAPL